MRPGRWGLARSSPLNPAVTTPPTPAMMSKRPGELYGDPRMQTGLSDTLPVTSHRGSPHDAAMGRSLSPQHFQAVLDDWRKLLPGIDWVLRGRTGQGPLLAVTIGIDWIEAEQALRACLDKAVTAIATIAIAAWPGLMRPDNLDEWIRRQFVRRGPEFMISDSARRTALSAWVRRSPASSWLTSLESGRSSH